MKTLRLFLSSPGDVAQERRIAERVIARLDAEFSTVKLAPYFWEYEPMVITKDYQEQIPAPSEFDIVICILWSRMGSRMHTKYQRQDGTAFRSGTEYEFVDAVEGQRRNDGTPDVLVWINKTQPLIPLEPEEAHMERLRQWKELKAFLEEWTRDGEEGTFKGAVNRYGRLDEFEEKLELKLRKLIEARLDGGAEETASDAAEIVWKEGSPFRGLEAFYFEHAPVFFGRTEAVAKAVEAFRRQSTEKTSGFLLLAGASGSGKSSLARAGVVPMLVEPGVIEGIGLWRRAVMKPGTNPFAALAAALLEAEALPELGSDGTTAAELEKLFRERPVEAIGLGRGALSQAAALMQEEEKRKLAAKANDFERDGRHDDAASVQKRLDSLQPPQARLVVVVDQFEEIFAESISAEERDAFVRLGRELSESGRVLMLVTMRGDFLPRCAELPELLELMRGDRTLQIGPPTGTELGQIIRQPAQAAGLRFERDPTSGESLDERLRDAALNQPAVLPLLEFCLHELYEKRTKDGLLTFAAFEEIGGVEGALAKRAETVFDGLSADAQKTLPRLARATVAMGGVGEDERITRKRADYDLLTADAGSKALIDQLVKARLFVADAREGGGAEVSVAHEALLQAWPRFREAIDADREFLRSRSRVAASAKRWMEEGKNAEFLLPEGRMLAEGEELLVVRGEELAREEIEFVEASSGLARERREGRVRRLRRVAAALGILAVGAIAGAAFGFLGQSEAKKNAELAEAKTATAEAAQKETMDTLVSSDITMSSYQHNSVGHAFLARAVRNAPENALASVFLYTRLLNQPFMLPKAKSMASEGFAQCVYDKAGTRLLTWPTFADEGPVRLWDPESGEMLVELENRGAKAAAISPDGMLVVAGFSEEPSQIYDAKTGKAEGASLEGTEYAVAYDFSDDGQRLLVAGSSVTVWNLNERRRVGDPQIVPRARFFYSSLRPDGRQFFITSEGETRVIDAETGENTFAPIRHDTGGIRYAKYSDDGKEIITCGGDGTVRRWSSQSGEALGVPLEHSVPVIHAEFSPRGAQIASVTQDHRLFLWDIESGSQVASPMYFGGNLAFMGFLPDSQRLLLSTHDGLAYLVAPGFEERIAYALQPLTGVSGLAIDPVRERCALASGDGTTRFYSMKVSRRAGLRYAHRSDVPPIFSDDGSLVTGVNANGNIDVWRSLEGTRARPALESPGTVEAMRFRRDGQQLASSHGGGEVLLWPCSTGDGPVFSTKIENGAAGVLDVSEDGRRLIAGSSGHRIHGWDTASNEPLWEPISTIQPSCLRFLPGSAEFLSLTFGSGGEVAMWNAETGEASTRSFVSERGDFFNGFFDPDKDTFFGISASGVTCWDVASGEEGAAYSANAGFAHPMGLVLSVSRGNSTSVSVTDPVTGVGLSNIKIGMEVDWSLASPDGSRVAATTPTENGGMMRVWEALPPGVIQRPEWLAELAEMLGGARVPRSENVARPVPHDERVQRLVEMREEADVSTPEGRLASWLLDDPWTRRISPHSELTIREHILRDCAVPANERNSSVYELFYNYPGHPLVFAAVAELFRESMPDSAAWAEKRAVEQGENLAEFCYTVSGHCLENGDYESATQFLVRASERGHDEEAVKERARAIKKAAGLN
ncbi:MAG: NACHT and WD repeat domain-containing protein [Verrucomicrobiota bacterium]